MRSLRRSPLSSRDLALVATFAALIAVLGLPGQVSPFGGAVPITAQTLGVMLAGSVLGARRGALSVLVLLALVAAGLPLLAGGRGGLGVFASPSAGYLAGWVVGAWVVGRLTELWQGRPALAWSLAANIAGGILVVYAVGVPVQAWVLDVPLPAALATSAVFLPGDLLKAVLAAVLAGAVRRGYPVLDRGDRGDRGDREPARPGERAT